MSVWWRVRHLLAQTTTWASYPLNEFRYGIPCKVPLRRYQERYGSPATDDGGRFRLSLLRGLGFSGNPFTSGFSRLNGMYADGEYGFALEWCVPGLLREERTPVAMTTFDRDSYPDGWWIVIRQLQGVKWRRDLLQGARWERMLLHIVRDWAAAQEFAAVACIRGEDSRWRDHGSIRGFYLRYDVSAKRSGFRFHEGYKLWHLPLRNAPV